jgi:hypothetical protein
VTVVGKKIGNTQLYTKQETIHKTIQKHRIQKMENRYIKQEDKDKRNIKQH